jgi:glycosyltransferase involved in cell wall biosynthesis
MHIIELQCPTYFLWEQWALPRAARKAGVEMLHCTSNTGPLHCRIPLLLTLHDVIFMEGPSRSASLYQRLGNEYRRLVVPRLVPRCSQIITVSDFERSNIMQTLGVQKEKITVLHNGYDDIFRPIDDGKDIHKKYIDETGYFFILGNTDTRKNVERMLMAYASYLEQSAIRRKLLMTSLKEEYLNELLERNRIRNIREHIVLTGYVPIEDLPYLYNDAFAFLFVSLREGFGIPILESMACGTPVITSNTSSMPEVAGDKALLVNPEQPEEIAQMMQRLERDELLYKAQQEYGLRRIESFSWKETTRQLVQIYKGIYETT